VLAVLLFSRTAGRSAVALRQALIPLWPQFTYTGVWSAAAAAYLTGHFLHLQSSGQGSNIRNTVLIGTLDLGAAIVCGTAALVLTSLATVEVSSASDSQEKMQATFRRLLSKARPYLLQLLPTTAQILLLVLTLFNALLWLTGVTGRTPFFQPGASALVTLIFNAGILIWRVRRSSNVGG
jgi:hypothetical protein